MGFGKSISKAAKSFGKSISTAYKSISKALGTALKQIEAEIDRFLDRLLGSTKTYTDIQLVKLITPNRADETARDTAIYDSGGNLAVYSASYKAFQRSYKRRFNHSFLVNLGFAPTSTAVTKLLQEAKVLDYVQTKDEEADELLTYASRYITEEEAAYNWLEDNVGWSNLNKNVYVDDVEYVGLEVSTDTELIYMGMFQEPIYNITTDLTDNYSYDDENETVLLDTGSKTANISGTSTEDSVKVRVTVGDVQEEVFDPIEGNTDWEFTTQELDNGSYTVKVYNTTSDDSESETDSYDITINSMEEYNVPELDDEQYGEFYNTVVSRVSDDVEQTIYTPIIRVRWTISYDEVHDEKLVTTYTRGDVEYYYYIEDIATVPSDLYMSATVHVTPIIPMKENNIIINPNRRMEKLLRYLDVTRGSLLSSLQNRDVDAAYVFLGVYPNVQTQSGMRAVFDTFNSVSAGDEQVTISISTLRMMYSFSIKKEVINGTVLPKGHYSNSNVFDPQGSSTEWYFNIVKTLIHQDTAEQYHKLTISKYVQRYTIAGEDVWATLASPVKHSTLILPLHVLNNLPYRQWVEVYEDGLQFMAYSVETVETSWEESTAFGVILKVFAVILFIVGLVNLWNGAGEMLWTEAALLWSGGEFVAAVVFFVTMVAVMSLPVLIAMVVYAALVALGVDPLIASLITIAVTVGIGQVSGISFGKEQWLQLANKGLDDQAGIYQGQIQDIQAENTADAKAMQEKNDYVIALLESMRSYQGVTADFNMNLTHTPTVTEVAELYAELKTEPYDFDKLYDVDNAIDSHKNIKVA